jgi:hypothetical protein
MLPLFAFWIPYLYFYFYDILLDFGTVLTVWYLRFIGNIISINITGIGTTMVYCFQTWVQYSLLVTLYLLTLQVLVRLWYIVSRHGYNIHRHWRMYCRKWLLTGRTWAQYSFLLTYYCKWLVTVWHKHCTHCWTNVTLKIVA